MIDGKKDIVFIEPAGNDASVFEKFLRLPLTGCLYLGTILHNAGHRVRIYHEGIMPRPFDPFTERADVYCITSLTVSANRARLLASQIRHIYADAKIILGGIHASLAPEDFLDAADHVVRGEAEGLIVDLVEGKIKEKLVQGSPVEDVNTLPLINYSLLQGHDTMRIIPVMTSRGCPFDCNFCTVTGVFGRQFRMQSAERVVAEVRNALTYFSIRSIFFYDDNFTANKERAHKICDMLVREKVDIVWTSQVRADIARDPELVEKMSQAGCRWYFIGFESITDAALAAYHKSQTRADIEKSIRVIHNFGINIHGMFMFGEDNDTLESLRETAQFAIRHDIDTVQFMILTPFPGTRLFDKIVGENRLYHKRWDYFDGMYAVFRPKNMSALTLQNESIAAYRKFYSLRRLTLRALELVILVTIDALTWNFKRVFRYGFNSMYITAAGRFMVSRFGASQDTYRQFLNDIERQMQHKQPAL
jgi:radical SAM superfamily enzyme YgiQ (UPF0313 family)